MSDDRRPVMLYVIGIPGSGKTTALRTAVSDAARHIQEQSPVPYMRHEWDFHHNTYCEVCGRGDQNKPSGFRLFEIGAGRDGFGGTDALGYNAQPKVLEWLGHLKPKVIVAEGDRLANTAFFRGVLDLGYVLTIAYIDTPADVAAQRRFDRAESLGTKLQDERWLKGRATKVHNIVSAWCGVVERIDGRQAPGVIATRLRESRVFRELEQARA